MFFNKFFSCVAVAATVMVASIFADDTTCAYGTLDNGLTYYVKENNVQDQDDAVTIQLVVKVGSAVETDDEKGAACLLGEVNKSIVDKTLSANNYSYSNYTTTYCEYNIFSDDENDVAIEPQIALDKVLPSISSTIFNADLNDAQIEKTKAAVINYLYGSKGIKKAHSVGVSLLNNWFSNTSFADKIPVPSQEELQKISGDTVRKFYGKWYNPKFMAVIIVGNINKDKTVEAIKKYFSKTSQATMDQIPLYNLNKDYGNTINIFKGNATYECQFTFAKIGIIANNLENNLKRKFLSACVFDVMKNKVQDNVKDWLSIYEHGSEIEMAALCVFSDATSLLSSMQYVANQMQLLKEQGMTYTDMSQVKDDILQDLNCYLTENTMYNDDYAEHYQELFLNGLPGISLEDKCRLEQQVVADLSLEEINNFAKKFLDIKKWSVVVNEPTDSVNIDEKIVREILKTDK
jgi:predicted Zn-dependent peptidase